MASIRLLSVLLAVVAVSTLAFGSVGYTSVSADRSVSVSVADNQDAYVSVTASVVGNQGVSQTKSTATNGQSTHSAEAASTSPAASTESASSFDHTHAEQTDSNREKIQLSVKNTLDRPFTVSVVSNGHAGYVDGYDNNELGTVEAGHEEQFGLSEAELTIPDDTDELTVGVTTDDGSFSAEITVQVREQSEASQLPTTEVVGN
jgi:hypothetical protein